MKQAIILAAGEGQRLRPFTVNKPKAMLSIAGKPILGYVIDALVANGIRNIVIVVGYKKEEVYNWLGTAEKLGVEITCVTQEKRLGTAHALTQARELAEEEFLVLPGDNLIEAKTIAKFVSIKPAAMLVKMVDNPVRYGVVTVEKGLAKGIEEKPREAQSNIINTGIYAFTKDIFSLVESELNIPDALNNMIAQGYSINTVEVEGTWLDAVYPWDILSLNDAALHRIPPSLDGIIEKGVSVSGLVSVGKDTVIRSNSYIMGPAIIGEGCEIGPNVCIMPATSIGDNVVISPFTQVKNSVIGNDCNIGAGCIIQDSVFDKGSVIGAHFAACSGEADVKIDAEHHQVMTGAMMGEGCSLDNCIIAQPGVIVGNHSQIQSLKLISGRLPDKSVVL